MTGEGRAVVNDEHAGDDGTGSSTLDVIPPDDQEQIAEALQDNAELVSTTQLEELPVPVLACLLGFLNSFRMMRLTDVAPSEAAEGVLGG